MITLAQFPESPPGVHPTHIFLFLQKVTGKNRAGSGSLLAGIPQFHFTSRSSFAAALTPPVKPPGRTYLGLTVSSAENIVS